jgi:hypothetical protein
VVLCAALTPDELASLDDPTMTEDQQSQAPIQDNAPANYAIYMFDPAKQTWLIVAAPPEGFMYTDPIALQARAEPAAAQDTPVDSNLAAQGLALIEVRSVYDTDGLNRMAEQMLTSIDRPAGCSVGIATMTPTDPLETRAKVPDIVRMKDPADAAYGCSPARFVRAVRAVAPPSNSMGIRSAIGQTDFEQQQIVGYAPVEPDGSFKLQVPADVPLALSIIDAQGRAFQTHTNWIQVRPGERRTCDGCHSPRRGGALNSGTVVNSVPNALNKALSANHQLGETLAALRTRLDPSALTLAVDPVFSDIWADTSQPNVKAKAAITLRYIGNADPADDLATPAPVNGLINYPDHIQPLWSRTRGNAGVNTCTGCHANTDKLDLRNTVAGSGRLVSYEELLVGDPVIDPVTGKPVTRIEEGVPVVVRQPALVQTSSGASNTAGQARKSRLTEILFGETLFAGANATTLHPSPPQTAPDHSTLLNRAEKRLLAEWMDLGGQYYNDPFAYGSNVRTVNTLDQASFTTNVLPVLRANCASACHQAVGSETSFAQNRFVLTGNAEGDFGATLAMVSDVCQPAQNLLLSRPSTVPHPAGALTQINAVLPVGSAGYSAIATWISKGCSAR